MKKIVIHSVTIRAELVDEVNPAESKPWQRTFTPEETGLPGVIKEIFRNAAWFILHNVIEERERG